MSSVRALACATRVLSASRGLVRPRAWGSAALSRGFSGEAQPAGGAAGAPGAADAGAAGASTAGAAAAGADAATAALRAELADAQKRLRESLEARAYLQADMENVRRIAKNDVDRAKLYAAQPIAKGLLLAVDNLQAALAAVPPGAAANPESAVLVEGVQSTLKITLKVLAEHGAVQFGAPGERFDPNVHEAVAMLPAAPGVVPQTILQVLKPGFMFKDRAMRAAQVTVAVKPSVVDEAKAAQEATKDSTRTI